MRRLFAKVSMLSTAMLVASYLLVYAVQGGRDSEPPGGARRVESLLNSLESSPDFKVRLAATGELAKLANGTVADWMLRAFRKEGNEAVRLAILYAVGRIPEHLILAPLVELVNQELLSGPELIAVERTVWNFRSAVALSEWTKTLLDSKEREERATSAYILGLAGNLSVLPALSASFTDPIAQVRQRAVQATGRIGARNAKPMCERMARYDPDESVRRAAQACAAEIAMIVRGSYPPENARHVDLHLDLYGLAPHAFTPQLMHHYLRRNVNPRALERALANLTEKDRAEERGDRTIPVFRSPDATRTLKYAAEMITGFQFSGADVGRLKEVIKENAGKINVCYLAALKTDRKLAGNVTAQFLVLQNGDVSSVEILETTLPDRGVPACVAEKVRTLGFPSIAFKYVTIKYTFVFVPPKDVKYEFPGS